MKLKITLNIDLSVCWVSEGGKSENKRKSCTASYIHNFNNCLLTEHGKN